MPPQSRQTGRSPLQPGEWVKLVMRFHPPDLVVEDKPSAAGLCATTAVAAQSSVSGALAQLGPTGRDVIAWVLPSRLGRVPVTSLWILPPVPLLAQLLQ